MTPDSLSRAASDVLACYAAPELSRAALGNAGGFSGARLWRVAAADGDWCLKAWPADAMSAPRLAQIHAWMSAAREAGLDFVPTVRIARDGVSALELAGRVWDMCEWMPGRAHVPATVKREHVSAAAEALARLHGVWFRLESRRGPCTAIARRLRRIAEWTEAVASGWRPDFAGDDAVASLAQQVWELAPPAVELSRRLLEPLRDTPFRLHPTMGDIWHDNVLFTEAHVTGVIDYGAARIDTPAVDLARLFGSYAPSDDTLFFHALDAYRAAGPLFADEFRLAGVLEYTGALIGAANWLMWIYHDRREVEDHAAVARRLAALVRRLERARRFTVPMMV
jgi:thiamine kinase-like enzyme